MHNAAEILGRLTKATLVAALVAGTTATASAATPPVLAPGWQALLGCWEPVATARDAAPDSTRGHLVCIVPVEGSTTAVDMVTVVEGNVIERERVDANGVQHPLTRDDCSGWQRAEWSATGQRVYLRSELTCEGGLKRTSTGVISMPSPGEWVDVQSVAVGERKAVRALRYREARSYASIPAAVQAALGSRPSSIGANTARMAAAAPVSPADLVDVTRHLDAAATEVWLVEQELAFTADAKALVKLADAGIPSSVIDVVVALSYPEQFTVATEPRPSRQDVAALYPAGGYPAFGIDRYDPYWDPYFGSRYDRRYYSPYGYSQYGRGYGYGSGWYPSNRPVIIVVGPANPDDGVGTPGQATSEGRVVKGRGYTRRPEPTPTTDRQRPSSDGSSGSSSSGGSATSSGSSSGSGSASGSSGSTGRTAKKRPPPAGSN